MHVDGIDDRELESRASRPCLVRGLAASNSGVPANPAPSMRQGDVVVNGTNALVRQDGSPCRFQINPATAIIEADGGTTTVSVATEAGCNWNASAW